MPPARRRTGERSGEALLITTAAPGHREDLRRREVRYAMQQGLRVVCFVAALFLPGWWRVPAIIGAVVLPFIAVTAANARGPRRGGRPDVTPVEAVAATPVRALDRSRIIDAE